MRKIGIKTVCGRILLVAVAGIPAFGASFTFNFNSLTGYSSTAGNQALSIESQLTTQLQTVCPACTVTVLNGTASDGNQMGAIIDKSYNGDGNAVGPTSGSSVISETLGDTPGPTSGVNNPNVSGDVITSNSQYSYSQLKTKGYTNQFLATTNDSSKALSTQNGIEDQITLQFHGLTVTGASFNYEIFPDASSQQPPDLTLEAGTGTKGVDTSVFTQNGITSSGSGTDGSSTHSPASGCCGSGTTEKNAQYIGSWSGTFSAATELDFVDWPATIGIDNLTISWYTPSAVPEPGSLVLLGTALAGLALLLRRKARNI